MHQQQHHNCCEVYVHLFRRDLRTQDNTAFLECWDHARHRSASKPVYVLPLFIYDDTRQSDPNNNPYFSATAFAYMQRCLDDLDESLRSASALHAKQKKSRKVQLHPGLAREVLPACDKNEKNETNEADVIFRALSKLSPTVSKRSPQKKTKGSHGILYQLSRLYFNADLTPFARKRDADLIHALGVSDVSGPSQIEVHVSEDYTLVPLEDPDTKNQQGHPYRVFGMFYKKRHDFLQRVQPPRPFDVCYKYKDSGHKPPPLTYKGSKERENALRILHTIEQGAFADYERTRNDLELDTDPQGSSNIERSTTRLSAPLKFGCISIREAFTTFSKASEASSSSNPIDSPLVRQLLFREFYYRVAWFFPRVLQGMVVPGGKNSAFDLRLDGIRWKKDEEAFRKWREGATGTPLVDAGMRQLNETGFMHNRCRMVTAMYLCKDLWMDWREGERYFASRLTDYDPCQNSAGWQWSAGVGSDAAPYFRIMNPYVQQTRFDPHGRYVRLWLPEFRGVPEEADLSAILKNWEDADVRREAREKYSSLRDYPDPIVPDHTRAAREAVQLFKNHLSSTSQVKHSE